MRRRWIAIIAVMALTLTACGRDDGGEVRDLDPSGAASGTGSGTGSGSGSGPGSASGPGSGTASGTSEGMGGYTPVSDVSAHARVVLDICELNELLSSDAAIDFDAVLALYEDGSNSVNSDGSVRTISGFARTERDEAIWNDYAEFYEDPLWLDTFVSNAISGAAAFEGETDLVRRQGVQKGIQNQIMVAWMIHELVAAVEKAEAGEFDPAEGAPHNWDEAWAFYHGEAPECAPYDTADSRGENFGTGTAVNDALLAAFTQGVEALVAEDLAAASTASEEILRQIAITYTQATIRYANQIDSALAEGNEEGARISQAEGWSFFRVIEPRVATVDAAAAASVADRFDLSLGEPRIGSAEVVETALESVYDGLGISPGEIGELSS